MFKKGIISQERSAFIKMFMIFSKKIEWRSISVLLEAVFKYSIPGFHNAQSKAQEYQLK